MQSSLCSVGSVLDFVWLLKLNWRSWREKKGQSLWILDKEIKVASYKRREKGAMESGPTRTWAPWWSHGLDAMIVDWCRKRTATGMMGSTGSLFIYLLEAQSMAGN